MKIIASIFVFTLLLVGVSGCKLKVQQPDPEYPGPKECNEQPSLPGCEKEWDVGYKKMVSTKSYCLTSATGCGTNPSQTADTAWLSAFDAGNLAMTVSNTNSIIASDGTAFFVAEDMQGQVVSTYEAPWSRTGQNVIFNNSYGVNAWVDSLPAGIGKIDADLPIAFGAGYGYVQLNAMIKFNGAPVDMRMESFVQCDVIPGAPPSTTAFLCDGE
jgi:hypothetical protein